MIVGLTGSIATGKSTVSAVLKEFGAYIVDADLWARRVVERRSDGLRDIVDAFGPEVLCPDGSLNRKALASLIFANPEARQRLNAITHPRIRSGMQSETKSHLLHHPDEPIVWDVPLLFEGETRHLVDCIVLVYASPSVQLKRLMARDGIDKNAAQARIDSQMPIDEKRKLATYLIDNDGDFENTREQVQQVWRTIRSRAKSERA